ncbi:MAG: diguanylate cyclase (GGDEF)-like protein [Cognaticolwellia sp.]
MTQLQELVRENDKYFRYAGDEFVVVLASQTLLEAEQTSDRLCQFFNNHSMPYQHIRLPISISCGAATSSGEETMDNYKQ